MFRAAGCGPEARSDCAPRNDPPHAYASASAQLIWENVYSFDNWKYVFKINLLWMKPRYSNEKKRKGKKVINENWNNLLLLQSALSRRKFVLAFSRTFDPLMNKIWRHLCWNYKREWSLYWRRKREGSITILQIIYACFIDIWSRSNIKKMSDIHLNLCL